MANDIPYRKGNILFVAGEEIERVLNQNNWPFCFIGGLAVLRWGEIRMTQDVDLCLLCGFGEEIQYIDLLLSKFESRIPDASDFAVQNRVLLLRATNGVALDISLSGLPFESEMIKRASKFEFEKGISLTTCSGEDLVVLKAFANRRKDWLDIEGIFQNNVDLNRDNILERLKPLAEVKDISEVLDIIRKL